MSNAATPSVEHVEMSNKWHLIQALRGGTPAMRRAGITYLPQEEAESDANYSNRLDRSILYEALNDTIEKVTALPFSRPVTVEDDPFDIIHDVDGLGTNLTQFAKALMDDMATYGKCHALVDFPAVEGELTLKDEVDQGIRPYWSRISPEDLIAWTYDGPELTSIRFKQTVVESVSRFETAYVTYVYEYTKETITKFAKDGDDDWKEISSTTNTLGEVPLVTAYAKKDGEMCSCPPYEKLAYLNLAHWQSQSDQFNILRFARFAILFGSGLDDDAVKQKQVIGPMNMIKTTSENADLKFVEHNGSAIDAGRTSLIDLQNLMEVVGTQPLIDKTGNSTATGKAIDASRNQAEVQAWIRSLEQAIIDAFKFHGKWTDTDAEVKVKIYSDFKVSLFGASDIDTLSKLAIAGKLSTSTLLNEMKRRGMVAEDVDTQEELDRIEEETLASFSLIPEEEEVPEVEENIDE